MSEQADKQEQATPFKLEEAKKKGQVGRSLEFTGLFSLVAMLISFAIFFSDISSTMQRNTHDFLLHSSIYAKDTGVLANALTDYFSSLAYILLPIWTAGIIAAVIANIVHTGPVFSTFPLKPDFSKLNPVKGFKKIFSRRALVELAKLVVKLMLFVGLLYAAWDALFSQVLFSGNGGVQLSLSAWNQTTWQVIKICLGVFLLSALFDLWYSKKDFAKQMRMSKRDIKDENKRRDGDPEIKSKRRRDQLELMKKLRAVSKVKDADVIIVNPTHYAVALKYRAKTMALPVVLASGKGFLANFIKRRARVHSIPILSRPALTRYVAKHSTIGGLIPLNKQREIAEVYRWVIDQPNSKVMS